MRFQFIYLWINSGSGIRDVQLEMCHSSRRFAWLEKEPDFPSSCICDRILFNRILQWLTSVPGEQEKIPNTIILCISMSVYPRTPSKLHVMSLSNTYMYYGKTIVAAIHIFIKKVGLRFKSSSNIHREEWKGGELMICSRICPSIRQNDFCNHIIYPISSASNPRQAGLFSAIPLAGCCWALSQGEHLEPIWPLVPYTTPMYGWCQWVPAADEWKINALKLYSM